MPEHTVLASRRAVLSAAVLLGGGAALTQGLTPAAAAETASAAGRPSGYSGLFVETADSYNPTEIYRYWSRFSSTRQEAGEAGVRVVNPETNTVYAGGRRPENLGLTATNMTTTSYQLSPETTALGWVCGMVVTGPTLYFSTGDGGIYAHTMARGAQDPTSYRKLHTLAGSGQQRAEGWAATSTHAVFGTAPEGINNYHEAPDGSTGALGVINKATGAVTIRHDLFPGHRVTHLTALGNVVYGVTRPNEQHTYQLVPKIFAYDPAASKVLWERDEPLRTANYWSYDVLHSIVSLLGKIYVAGESVVQEVDPSTGQRLRAFNIGHPDEYFSRSDPGKVILSVVGAANRLFFKYQRGQVIISLPSGRTSDVTLPYVPDLFHTATGALLIADVGHSSYRATTIRNAWDGRAYRGPVMSPFTDVSTGGAFYNEIAWLSEVKVSSGWNTSTGKQFRPGARVTRDVMAAFLYRLAGSPEYTAPTTSPFADVPPSRTFYREMAWLAEQGVSNGWVGPNGTRLYKPDQNVLRDQMAAFMYRLAGKPEYFPAAKSPFIDVSTGHDFYKEISWLAAKGVSGGWNTSRGKEFRPYQPVLRDQMAAFMYRLAATAL